MLLRKADVVPPSKTKAGRGALAPGNTSSLAPSLILGLILGIEEFLSSPPNIEEGRLVSLTLPLPADLVPLPQLGAKGYCFLGRPSEDAFLLGFGRAASVGAGGPGRFARLLEFLKKNRPGWVRLDPKGTGLGPLAMIGFAFDPGAVPSHPNTEAVVPRILVQRRAGTVAATFTGRFEKAGPKAMAARWLAMIDEAFSEPGKDTPRAKISPHPQRVGSEPQDSFWLDRTARAISAIREGGLEKAVLSRCIRVSRKEAFEPARVMAHLRRRYPSCTLFAFDHGDSVTVGASPERLVSLQNGLVRSDTLAGSNRLNGSSLDASLLTSLKNLHEHQLVVEAVLSSLDPLCTTIHAPDSPQLFRLANLQHLWTPVTANARPGTSVLDLAASLHPTPAVGGTPRGRALEWMVRNGEHRLGWYTGGVGWVCPCGDGEISVVLRCATLAGRMAQLSAGAGIVADSDPEMELEETELKLGAMLDALKEA